MKSLDGVDVHVNFVSIDGRPSGVLALRMGHAVMPVFLPQGAVTRPIISEDDGGSGDQLLDVGNQSVAGAVGDDTGPVAA